MPPVSAGIAQAAKELKPEIASCLGVQESEIHSLQVNQRSGSPNVLVTTNSTQRNVYLAVALAKRLASPISKADIGTIEDDPRLPNKVPDQLTEVARIYPPLKWLGKYAYHFSPYELHRWLHGSLDNYTEDGEKHFERTTGAIEEVADVLALVLLSPVASEPLFADRWGDLRGDGWGREEGESLADFRDRTSRVTEGPNGKIQRAPWAHEAARCRLENWNPQEEHFETFLSRAVIGTSFWLTENLLAKNYKELRRSLIAAATTPPLQCRQAPACGCPICQSTKLCATDNTCEGVTYGHFPMIVTGVYRFFPKDTWQEVVAHKCGKCERLFFVPQSEFERQFAVGLLRIKPGAKGREKQKVALQKAAKLTPLLTQKELLARHRTIWAKSEQDQEEEYFRLSHVSKQPPFACPNTECKGVDWQQGSTSFWVPSKAPVPPSQASRNELKQVLQDFLSEFKSADNGELRWTYLLLVNEYPEVTASNAEKDEYSRLTHQQKERARARLIDESDAPGGV
jgi:hypothetical protein